MKLKQIIGLLLVGALLSLGPLVAFNRSDLKELGASSSAVERDLRLKKSFDFIGTSSSSLATLTNSFDGASSTYKVPFLGNMHLDVDFQATSTGQNLQVLIETSNDDGQSYYPIGVKNIATTTVEIYTLGPGLGIPLSFFHTTSTVTGTLYRLADDYNFVGDYVRISARCSTGNSCEAHIRGTFVTN